MAFSSPLIFKYTRHLEAQGQAYDIYRWYLPDSAGYWEFGSREMKLRNVEAVLRKAPESDISSSADRAIYRNSKSLRLSNKTRIINSKSEGMITKISNWQNGLANQFLSIHAEEKWSIPKVLQETNISQNQWKSSSSDMIKVLGGRRKGNIWSQFLNLIRPISKYAKLIN